MKDSDFGEALQGRVSGERNASAIVLKRLLVCFVLPVLFGCTPALPNLGGPEFQTSFERSSADVPAATCPATVLVPLYTYPGTTWNEIEHERQLHPSTPITAIINPNSGPGGSRDPVYASGIAALQRAGVVVLGYDHTSYAKRATADVEKDARLYHQWYAVNGIFFDEMSNIAGKEQYYRTLSAYVRSLGMHPTIGNPGTDTLKTYVGTVDSIVIYESAGYPPLSRFGGWHTMHPKSNWGSIAYSVGTLDVAKVCALSHVAGYIYVTDAGPPNPYDRLPPYFDGLVKTL